MGTKEDQAPVRDLEELLRNELHVSIQTSWYNSVFLERTYKLFNPNVIIFP